MSSYLTSPNPISLNIVELQHHLDEVLERLQYPFEQYRILRNDKPIARMVNERYIQAMERLIGGDSSLVETLEIMLDDEAVQAIEQGTKEIAKGKFIPLESILKD